MEPPRENVKFIPQSYDHRREISSLGLRINSWPIFIFHLKPKGYSTTMNSIVVILLTLGAAGK